jgi:hypothetical protein
MKTLLRCQLLLIVLIVTASGCGRSDLVSAGGKVTYKGQPVAHVYVIFHPTEEGKRASRGLTDDNGNFVLTNSREDIGVLLGKHTVTVESHHTTDPQTLKELKGALAKYSDVKKSPLQLDITGGGQFLDIKLD